MSKRFMDLFIPCSGRLYGMLDTVIFMIERKNTIDFNLSQWYY